MRGVRSEAAAGSDYWDLWSNKAYFDHVSSPILNSLHEKNKQTDLALKPPRDATIAFCVLPRSPGLPFLLLLSTTTNRNVI